MSDGSPQVEKRFYTRLMDLYRHNEIYIPGFNFVARTALRSKAEAHFSFLAQRAQKDTVVILEWYGQHRFFFGFGMFRSGTTFLADFLNRHAKNSIVMHEANVNDYWFYAKAMHSHAEALKYVKDYRMAEVYYRMHGHSFQIYGEINPFLRRHAVALKQLLPDAAQFQLVRDPKNVIRSLMSRELFDRKDPMGKVIFPPKEDPFSEQWPKMNRFERLCWLWAADNRFLRENIPHTIRFEDLRTDFELFDEQVLKYLGLQMDRDDWNREIGEVFNSTPRYTFPKYAEWGAKDKKAFERICAEEAANYNY
jgi:hypothetical protein